MTSVQYLKGVGPKRAKILEKLGIFTVSDLLFYFPRGWQDRRLKQDSCCHTDAEGNVIFLGTAASSKLIETGKSLGIFRATLIGGTGQSIEAYWFKRLSYSYDVFAPLRRDMAQGNLVWIAGKKEEALSRIVAEDEAYFEGKRVVEKLKDVFEKNKIDKIVHLAARAGVRPSIENPELYTQVNVLGTVNLLKLSADFKIKQFIKLKKKGVQSRYKLILKTVPDQD